MRFLSINTIFAITFLGIASSTLAHPTFANTPLHHAAFPVSKPIDQSVSASHTRSSPSSSISTQFQLAHNQPTISLRLFHSLEELARLVDISYCIGTSGISKPFQCASRCDEFPGYELVDTFNTGVVKSDSSGYIVLDHGLQSGGDGRGGRIIVAFRGTYSIANTIADLSTVPQEYIPYPEDPDDQGASGATSETSVVQRLFGRIRRPWRFRWQHALKSMTTKQNLRKLERKCTNCTVHTGFYTSWLNTRPYILPHLNVLKQKYPEYQLHLVGHSLGGAVAALAGLELEGNGWRTMVTTFGEPMIGNDGLMEFIDGVFELDERDHDGMDRRYRKVTHVGDPVPLLPLKEWGYRTHAGEIYIGKENLQPEVQDIHLCYGDEDKDCITGSDGDNLWFQGEDISSIIPVNFLDEIRNSKWGTIEETEAKTEEKNEDMHLKKIQKRWLNLPVPTRYKLWQLFFAHRDYFWRLGVCLPGGDPLDWRRPGYNFTGMETKGDRERDGDGDMEEL